jgi:hypothetical protein
MIYKIKIYMNTDKILNNRWNTGTVEYEEFGKLKILEIDEDVDLTNNLEKETINNEILRIFKKSKWFHTLKSPSDKLLKSEMIQVWIYFNENLEIYISPVDLFINICEFFGCNYKFFYEQLSISQKETILTDLDNKTGIIKNKKINKLF